MSYILNLETSTTNCSVSLFKGEQLCVIREDYNSNYSHAESLHVFINDVLNEAQVNAKELDAVAVSKGPGSYTGLRIGVSAAKGLCFALDIPLIAVNTLEALAHQVNIDSGIIIPMLDARRMEVYVAAFDAQHQEVMPIQSKILEADSFSNFLASNSVYFIGNGVSKTKTLIHHENAVFIEDKLPSAKYMGALAYKKFVSSQFEDVAYFEPFYLKDFMGTKA